ncbi:transposase (fragment) [Xenorhabdus bovienii str. kraussei Quebec]|uniref:Transposase n=1 Tax=Xenorhabdus bovienii str. kraussei Quebec TaxID=1398203 RepID=A0A077PE01_XENBV
MSKETPSWRSSGKINLEELYCHVDDFCQKLIPLWHQKLIEYGLLTRYLPASLFLSEAGR